MHTIHSSKKPLSEAPCIPKEHLSTYIGKTIIHYSIIPSHTYRLHNERKRQRRMMFEHEHREVTLLHIHGNYAMILKDSFHTPYIAPITELYPTPYIVPVGKLNTEI